MKSPMKCSQCEDDTEVTLKQEGLCSEHARERLDELRSEAEELQEQLSEAKNEYEALKEEYEVGGYGHIEHQLSVEGREDINEDDVEEVNQSESEFVSIREEYKSVKALVDSLERQLD